MANQNLDNKECLITKGIISSTGCLNDLEGVDVNCIDSAFLANLPQDTLDILIMKYHDGECSQAEEKLVNMFLNCEVSPLSSTFSQKDINGKESATGLLVEVGIAANSWTRDVISKTNVAVDNIDRKVVNSDFVSSEGSKPNSNNAPYSIANSDTPYAALSKVGWLSSGAMLAASLMLVFPYFSTYIGAKPSDKFANFSIQRGTAVVGDMASLNVSASDSVGVTEVSTGQKLTSVVASDDIVSEVISDNTKSSNNDTISSLTSSPVLLEENFNSTDWPHLAAGHVSSPLEFQSIKTEKPFQIIFDKVSGATFFWLEGEEE